MALSWLTVRDLEYVVAVSQTLHFGKAAQACRVSQPALSVQIKKVEDLLGVQIFERTNRRVSVGEKGRAIVQQAQRILEEVNRLSDLGGEDTAPLSGALRLGCIATLGPYLMPHLLPGLRKAFPKARFLLKEGLTNGLLDELRHGELDMVLAADTFKDDSLRVQPVFFEPFFLTTPKGHELSKKDPLQLRDMRADEMVLLEDGHCLSDQTLGLCARGKGKTRQTFQATSLETLRHLVASGAGYTLIPALAVRAESRLNSLVTYRPFPKGVAKDVGRKIVLVSRKSYGRIVDVDAMASFLTSHLPDGVEAV